MSYEPSPAGSGGSSRDRTGDQDSPPAAAEVIALVRRHPVLLIGVPLLFAMAAVALRMAEPRTYTSRASFMGAATDASRNALGGLAAQLGIRVPSTDATQSPQFYADLLRSRGVLDSVVNTRYNYTNADGQRRAETLTEAFEARGRTEALKREHAMDLLDRAMAVTIGRETGVVRLSVKTESPELSYAVVSRFVELLNQFNLESRQTRASAERRFVQSRLNGAELELRTAEERLAAFDRTNRSYMNSPNLIAQRDRLQREVVMRQQVYTTLTEAHEQARIDEVRDTPVITVVERAYLPVRPDRRGLLRRAILGGVLGLVIGSFAAVALAARGRPAERGA